MSKEIMMMLDDITAPAPYATVDEVRAGVPAALTETLETMPTPEVERLIMFAGGVMRAATKRATYSTDADHMPTSATLRRIFREATIAQITVWVENGLTKDVLSGGVTSKVRVSSTSSNGKSLTLDTSAADTARAHLAAGGLGIEAQMILDSVGLRDGLPGVLR